ncbi:MAG: ribosome recycling factor [Campylobacterales bacterium]|nr:ribosome recycling factor [Campylobacterales bacterium]
MVSDVLNKTKESMEKSVEALKKDFGSLRTGKVSINILDGIMVDYYDNPTPINGVASIAATDATTIMVTPWEKPMVVEIERAIAEANIGVNPGNNGDAVILSFPPMTQENRQETAKQAKGMAENAKVSVRNHRQDGNKKIKNLEKDKEITEDEKKKAEADIQKLTDDYIAKVEEAFKKKEEEVLKV